ncbi:MAG: CRISPR-associated endonuclease Cas2 [Ignavibacteria bacterium]|nr:CRISPR-associated endonuclease Cas2 [Ignavibacteria bacterium]
MNLIPSRKINFLEPDEEEFTLSHKNKMYFILAYDITKPRRLTKTLKICRKYLNWVQKSVFEGHLTETQYKSLMKEIQKVIKPDEDSVITYCINDVHYLQKEVTGIEKNELSILI